MLQAKLTQEQLEKLLVWPERFIPHGIYCYRTICEDSTNNLIHIELCPFWDKDDAKPEGCNGYCHYLKQGDWETPGGLLWDQCKECGLNDVVFVGEEDGKED